MQKPQDIYCTIYFGYDDDNYNVYFAFLGQNLYQIQETGIQRK